MKKILSIILFVLATTPQLASAQDSTKKDNPDKGGIFSLVYENDLFSNKDEGYTSGIKLSWLASEDKTPKFIKLAVKKLSLTGTDNGHIGISVGQDIYTPSDLSKTQPTTNDQPYAGWIYSSLGVISDNSTTLNTAMLTIGVVGPLSYAKETQTKIHTIRGINKAQGWANQLQNEPGINFSYEKKWKSLIMITPIGFDVDFSPDYGFSLGNINTNASIGGTIRIGHDLPHDYGPPRIKPNLPGSDYFIPRNVLGAYLFASTHAQLVLRDIFLDGNTFQSSASVDKKPIIADLQLGAAMNYKNLRISYSYVFVTKDFYGQKTAPTFGSIAVSYRF